jgi:hypothetical protein
MKYLVLLKYTMVFTLLVLVGCGGSSSPAANSDITTPPANNQENIAPKQVLVMLSTTGIVPAGNTIKGLAFEINLPAGASVKSDANGVLPSYLLTSGVALTATSSYITGRVAGSKLFINFTSGSGISIGEFATLVCDLESTSIIPTKVSFPISFGYKVIDVVQGLGTVSLSDTISISVLSVIGK